MNISKAGRRCGPASNAGFTLIEGLVTLAICTFLLLFLSSLVTRMSRTKTYVSTRVLDEVDSNFGLRLLVGQLDRSQIARSGMLRCSGSDAMTGSGGSITLERGTPSVFAFPYWDAAVLGSLVPDGVNEIVVSDVGRFTVGSLISLASAEDASRSGLFRISSVDASDGVLALVPASLSDMSDLCTISSGESLSFAELRGTGGEAQSVFLVQRIRVAAYSADGDDLIMRTYPVPEGAEPAPTLVLPGFHRMDMNFEWTPYSGGDGKSGRMAVRFRAQVEVPSESGEKRQREISSQAGFEVTPVLRTNTDVVTVALPDSELFPTCSVFLAPADGIWTPPTMDVVNRRLFLLSGAVSEGSVFAAVLASLNRLDADADAVCTPFPIPHSGATEFLTDSVNLVMTSLGMPKFLCAIKGHISVTANMRYFDNAIKRQVSAACSETAVKVPATWKYSTGPSSCTRNGSIYIGTLVEDVAQNPVPGPLLYTDDRSCTWVIPADPPEPSMTESDASCEPRSNPNAQLQRVKLRPDGTEITGGSVEIVCH